MEGESGGGKKWGKGVGLPKVFPISGNLKPFCSPVQVSELCWYFVGCSTLLIPTPLPVFLMSQ